MVEAARVSTDSSAHQFSTGILRLERAADDAVDLAGLGAQPHEALDQVDVAQRVAGAAGELAVILLDLRLQAVGLARPRRRWRSAKKMISTISSAPSRQFMNRLSGSMMNSATKVARFSRKKRQPDAEQVVDAGQHDLEQAAGMLGVVEREGQRQHVLEVGRHGAEPAAVRHAVGLQRDDDVGDDAADADDRPDHQQLLGVVPQLVVASCPARSTAGRRPGRAAPARRTAGPPPRRWRTRA